MSSRCSFNHKTRERVLTTHTYMSDACPTGCANIIYMLALLVFSGILIIRCCSVVCSRAPPDPPRLRGRATSRPRSSPRDPRRKNGHRLQTRRARTFNTVGFPEAANDLSFSFGSAVERSIVVNQSSVWSLAYRRVLHLFFLFAPFLPTLKPIRFVAAGLPGSPPH